MTSWDAALYLECGSAFYGKGFGARQNSGGELVFNTGMTGYQEIFTDPSYSHQIVAMTYPHLGNTGLNDHDMESEIFHLKGIVARQYEPVPSNWRSCRPLHETMEQAGVPGISGVDTREITRVVRGQGAQRALIFACTGDRVGDEASARKLLEQTPAMEGLELVSRVSCRSEWEFSPSTGGQGTFTVMDFGVKHGILRQVRQHGFGVRVVPYNTSAKSILEKKPVAVLLSNGPGDPAGVPDAVETIRQLVGQVPILAICMGHQLLARALGCSTYKLPFGHHGVNHPVRDERTGRILITSQNHGFAVRSEDLAKQGLELTHISLNDGTVEGFASVKNRYTSVQFHPESSPGPHDGHAVFESFIKDFIR